MTKLLNTIMALSVAFALTAAPAAEAAAGMSMDDHSRRHEQKSNNSRRSKSEHKDKGNKRHDRPGHKKDDKKRPDRHDGHSRPGHGNGGHNSGHNSHNRPSGPNHQGRPNHTNHRPNRPNHHPNRPNHRPGTPPPPPRKHKHNYRHHVPFFGAYHRPVPPPHHYNRHGGPTFGTILGVALGTAINISLNTLINNGYNVSSYGNDVVYLTNVPQMNFYWPDAALYYNNGILTGSQFTYATPYYDTSRYNSLYSTFISQYGYPASTVNNGHTMSATWYGPSNRFVTISFTSQYGNNFYTTLSFGD